MAESRRERGRGRRGRRRKRRYEERRKEEEGGKRLSSRKLIYVILVIASVVTGFYLLNSFLRSSTEALPYKAAIVDHLSLLEPNQTFVNVSTAILEAGGFSVDYYSGEKVTVDFYRGLPSLGYGLIVLRVHSAAGNIRGEQSLALFTSEPYSEKDYEEEQRSGRVGPVGFLPYSEADPTYFGISPEFVRRSMEGRFKNTLVVLMGCDGLNTDTIKMAEAFVEKGAKVFISWDKAVSAAHTDYATIHLLQCLVAEKQAIGRAVEETMREVGPDPQYGSVLSYYPDKAGDYAIPDIEQ